MPTRRKEEKPDTATRRRPVEPGYKQMIVSIGSERRSPAPRTGLFIDDVYTNAAGSRAYKLYIPGSYAGQPLPLIVMLHGCYQTPDDFAHGTQMNLIAEQAGCFVVYPAQAHSANTSNCWNWYEPLDQRRDHGEPSIIAGITRTIAAFYHIDGRRIYVAGLSAGGAMAAIMAATYPEIYAAVGIHSGLPYGAAHDYMSALNAMQNGYTPANVLCRADDTVPTIVFHGDLDTTVHPMNAERMLAQVIDAIEPCAGPVTVNYVESALPQADTYAYTRTIRVNEEDRIFAEHWLVHGAGHAWCGGSARGTFTDEKGPDASYEMMRFFLGLARG
jgi:poly(hydroxyalkanoate) depolymerase family esterase